MPSARALPIPATHREFTVKVGGQAVPRQHQLLSVSIVKTANRLASARLAYLDGAASASDFPLSNAATFVPGAGVEVTAASGATSTTLFSGVVVRVSLRVRDHAAPQLIVDCRHKAVKLTIGRRNAFFADQSDAEIISTLLDNAGIQGDVESTSVRHGQVVQYRATDWDFLLARAAANGKMVLTNGDTVAVKAPRTSGQPVVTLQFGATILELDAEIDARTQFAAVKSHSWDPSQQAVVETDATDPGFAGPGNLASGDLANAIAPPSYDLQHAALTEDEAQAWADAEWQRSRLNKVSGRAKCEGMAALNPGDIAALSGVGNRVSGDIYITGIRHTFDTVQGWKTHVQFGGLPDAPARDEGASAPAAGDLIPSVRGLQVGVVTSNEDPGGEHRVRVRLPLVNPGDDGVWARVSSLDAGEERGFFFRPEIGDEVLVGFLDDDPRHPVILGMLHSSARPAPLQASDANPKKLYQSRSKMTLSFDDDKKVIQMATPAGNLLTLSEADQAVTITDQSGNTIDMKSDGVTITSATALTLKAGTTLVLESGTGLDLKSGTGLKLQGAASAEVSSTGVTKISGGIVQIN